MIYPSSVCSYTLVHPHVTFSTAIESIPENEKREYQRAKEIVPHLVRSETPILWFLRTKDYDPLAAAKQLITFWRHRKERFGERYLLPMMQTGHGALDANDMELLRTGALLIAFTERGQPIILTDYSRATKFFSEAVKRGIDAALAIERIAMYLTVVNGEVLSSSRDVILFHPIAPLPPSANRPAMEFRPKLWDMLRDSFPVKIRRSIVGQAYEESQEMLLDFIRYQTASVVAFNSRLRPVEIHEPSVRQTVQAILRHGIPRRTLPISLGGDFDYPTQVAEWVRMRSSIEDFLGAAAHPVPNAIPQDIILNAAGARRDANNYLVKRKRDEQGAVLESEEDFHRKRSALYSRRLYHKRKLEITVLQTKVESLQNQKSALQQDNERLETLVYQAHDLLLAYSDLAAPGLFPVQPVMTVPPAGNQWNIDETKYNQQHQVDPIFNPTEGLPFGSSNTQSIPALAKGSPLGSWHLAANATQVTQGFHRTWTEAAPQDQFTLAPLSCDHQMDPNNGELSAVNQDDAYLPLPFHPAPNNGGEKLTFPEGTWQC